MMAVYLYFAASVLLGLAAAVDATSGTKATNTTTCKVFPGDSKWPTDAQWTELNQTAKGSLIKAVPIGAPCYPGPLYDAKRCEYLIAQWSNSSLHMEDPTSMMSPMFQGLTCQPMLLSSNSTNSCSLGGFPQYAINATRVSDVQAAVNFVRKTGIRLIIKNTGHDFSGKSGGAGSLSIWTHHIKDVKFIDEYTGPSEDSYNGPAFKAGTGVQAWEIYEAAAAQKMVVVGGEGRTVGVMGGYILGGGHSPLSSLYGIAADHVLSFDVVLASGEFVTADSSRNADMFWALRGGGGSTYGVTTSITVKAYKDMPVTAFSFTFGGPGSNVTYDNFWKGVRAYFSHFIPFSDAGTYGYFWIFPAPVPIFQMIPFFAPNMSASATKALLKPWLDDLSLLGINVQPSYTEYPSFVSAWSANFPQESVGMGAGLTGSRLFPRKNWDTETSLNATFKAFKESVDQGLVLISFNMRTKARGNVDNAVNPAWRESVLHSIQTNSWAENATETEIQAARKLMFERQAAWKAVSEGAGSYLAESDRSELDFQQSFYGSKYARLLEIKKKVDPEDVFWAKTAVGSDAWEVQSKDVVSNENGKLCMV